MITTRKVIEFMKKSKLSWHDKHYLNEWISRFTSPRRAWSFSDRERRKVLRKMFPEKFKYLRLNTNLNNHKYMIRKYDYW